MPKVVKYKVGGREYLISEKVSGIAERWRKHLRETPLYNTFLSLDTVVERVIGIIENGVENLDAVPVISMARLLPAMVESLATSMDDIKALVFDYVPEMRDDKAWLDENVYDSEYVGVFVEVLKLNFPIMGALELMRGSRALGTSTNLPSMNGASGTKKRMARSKIR
jgi:hypothetical protein